MLPFIIIQKGQPSKWKEQQLKLCPKTGRKLGERCTFVWESLFSLGLLCLKIS